MFYSEPIHFQLFIQKIIKNEIYKNLYAIEKNK